MAQAYRHLGAGSHQQVLHFAHGRKSEIGTQTRMLMDEKDMWIVVCQRTDLSPALRAYQLSRVASIVTALNELALELALMEELLALLAPCPNCNGYGEVREFIAQDESRQHACPSCKGTGETATP